MPDLDFSVSGAQAVPYAAVPLLALKLTIVNRQPEPVRSVALNVQVRIAAPQRSYTTAEQRTLGDLFGPPDQWGKTLKSLLWMLTSVHVPAFEGQTTVDLALPCTFDFEVASAKYFAALENGVVPLELLFSGSVFYGTAAGLQVAQIGWDKEARFGLPVQVWQDVIGQYFPNTAWLRLSRDTFDRLAAYRTAQALPSLEAALERLLSPSEHQEMLETVWTR